MEGRTDALSAQLTYYKNLEDAIADVDARVSKLEAAKGESDVDAEEISAYVCRCIDNGKCEYFGSTDGSCFGCYGNTERGCDKEFALSVVAGVLRQCGLGDVASALGAVE